MGSDYNKNYMKKFLCFICVLFAMAYAVPMDAQTAKVRLQDNGKALVNPDMGWVLYFYSNEPYNYGSRLAPEDLVDDFPGLSTVYLRLPWAFIEPEEGKFNWEWLDTPAQRWIEVGKKVAFRITATEQWMSSATPDWVFDAGAKGFVLDTVGYMDRKISPYREPDYDDEIFLQKLDAFLGAMAERYDGNPNVAFVDIGHFGLWGEGHTLFTDRIHGHKWGDETRKRIIDLYCKHFKKTLLVMSDDFVGHRAPGIHFPVSDYALSKGVSLRDDSIVCGKNPPWYHDGMSVLYWPTLPVVLEHGHYQDIVNTGSWSREKVLQSVEDYHASYMSIHGWPREILSQNRSMVDSINLRLGYRIRLVEAEWPKTVKKGEPFNIIIGLQNAGVAPCYPGGRACFTIKNKRGGIVSVMVDNDFDVKSLSVGRPEKALVEWRSVECNVSPVMKDQFRSFVRACEPGKYKLYFSVGEEDGTPTLELPYDQSDGHKRYLLGDITIEE